MAETFSFTNINLYNKVDSLCDISVNNINTLDSYVAKLAWQKSELKKLGSAISEWMKKLGIPLLYRDSTNFFSIGKTYINKPTIYIHSGTFITSNCTKANAMLIMDMPNMDIHTGPVLFIEAAYDTAYAHFFNIHAHAVSHFQEGCAGYGRLLGYNIIPYPTECNKYTIDTLLTWTQKYIHR